MTCISSLAFGTPRLIIAGSLCLIAHVALPESARAQDRGEFELGLVKGVPIGDLGARIDRPAWGASFYGARLLPGTAVSVGARRTFVSLPDLAPYDPTRYLSR
jgi:hypothetical protein